MNTNNVSKIILLLITLVGFLMLAGCSTTDEQAVDEAQVASDQAAEDVTTTKDAEKSTQASQQTGEEKPKTDPAVEAIEKEESVVEVIPNQTSKEPQVTIEPIAPTVTEEIKAESPPAPAEEDVDTTEADKDVPEQTAKSDVPVSTGPDHFVITAAKKDSTHPHFGKGHAMGFVVNNEQGKEIVLERGKSYRVDVATDPKHDVYISLKEIGWGSTPYSQGIEGQYTYKGTITIKPDDKTPDILFYSCRNHPYMGGKIHVVNPGQTVEISEKVAKASTTASASAAKQITKADVNQKIMFADMLLNSKNSETVLKSNISDAVNLHKKAEADLNAAKENLKAGKNAEAYKQAENSIVLLKKATKLVPNESALARMKERNKELWISIKDFEASHEDSYKRIAKKQGKDAAVDYDKNEVKKLKDIANESAKKGDYSKANQSLEKAQRIITVALHKMLNNQTIIYDLNFETPEEEYKYELKRFSGYEELIPIAVEQKKPAEGAIKLMESFLKKGQDLRDRAVKKAKDGDFPTAIAMLQDATKDVRRALRMVGVMQ